MERDPFSGFVFQEVVDRDRIVWFTKRPCLMIILIVEDERPIAQALADNLEFEGYTVRLAHDGRSGLESRLACTRGRRDL